jgi:hypothetical protein
MKRCRQTGYIVTILTFKSKSKIGFPESHTLYNKYTILLRNPLCSNDLICMCQEPNYLEPISRKAEGGFQSREDVDAGLPGCKAEWTCK